MMTGGNYTYHGEYLVMYITVKPQCCIPETNLKLYAHYISIKSNDSKK